ncbi:MAG: hypothetical protein JXB29_07980 [Sedimentisphaerales bacterium]|nr:hypothetical protein [Sedimentisphaerales bacterium]
MWVYDGSNEICLSLKEQKTGKYNSNKLYNGSSWEDFKPTFPIPIQYLNESSTWVTFHTATAGRNYYQSNQKTEVLVGGQTGGSQGPWQQ